MSDKIDTLKHEHPYLTEYFLNALLEEKHQTENIKIIEEFKLVDIAKLSSLTDQKGNTLLHLAAINKHEDLMGLLINKGFNTTIKNQEGFTAQHYSPIPRSLI